MLGRLLGWHEEATSHPPSSPSSSPREEAMQMEMRNKYSCLLCATADVFQNVWLGPQNQAHPAKEALSRRKRGDRVAYLSIHVSFLGGRAHGSSLAALLRWGCGKCTVMLKEWNQKIGEELKASMPDSAQAAHLCPGPGTHSAASCIPSHLSCLPHPLPLPPPFHLYSVPGKLTPLGCQHPSEALCYLGRNSESMCREILATSKLSSHL